MNVKPLLILTFLSVCLLVTMFSTLPFLPRIEQAKATTLFSDGFESNDFSAWSGTNTGSGSTVETTSSDKHCGTYCAHFANPSANTAYARRTITASNDVYMRQYVKFIDPTVVDGDDTFVMRFADAGYNWMLIAGVEYDVGSGEYYWYLLSKDGGDSVSTYSAATFALDVGEWYCMEMHLVVDGTVGEVQLWIEDVSKIHLTNQDTDNLGDVDVVITGMDYRLGDAIYVDCVVVSTSFIGKEFDAAPTYSDVATNTTVVGQPVEFSVEWTSDAEHGVNMSGYIFGWDNGSETFQNDTWTDWGGDATVEWSNVTDKILNFTMTTEIHWNVWANDTNGNWTSIGSQSLTTSTPVTVTVYDPTWEYYITSNITVNFTATTLIDAIDTKWFNCKNASSWIYGSNTTYTTVVNMTGFGNGTDYTFYGWANATGGELGETIVKFRVDLTGFKALNGSALSIQEAVDAAAGNGIVYIPSGTFNFTDSAPWITVNVTDGIHLIGGVTERHANGSVVEWTTILIEPYDSHGTWHYGGNVTWFDVDGTFNESKNFRFSDIKLVGYRSINSSSTSAAKAIGINDMLNFRIDHCYLENTCLGTSASNSSGIFDHCSFVNTVGVVEPSIADCTVFYGVSVSRGYGDLWEDNTDNVLGQYLDYTVFIEDCYFEKWRHCVAANSGAHYIFRHCTIAEDYAYGSLDAHGWGVWDGEKVTQVGTRAQEVYENSFLTPDPVYTPDAIYFRGGGGVVYNNTFVDYTRVIYMSREAQTEVSKCWPHDIWIWNNDIGGGTLITIYNDPVKGGPQENVDYFLYEKTGYAPYPYPHPLTVEEGEEGENQPPSWYIYGSNNTIANRPTLLYSHWDDDSSLSHHITETNNTGTFANTTALAFSTTPDWANYTINFLDTTIGIRVAWRIHANDSDGDWAVFAWQYITVIGEGGWRIFVNTTGSIGFQTTPEHYVILTVSSGALDSSSNSLSMEYKKKRGTLVVNSSSAFTLTFDYTNESLYLVTQVNGGDWIPQLPDSTLAVSALDKLAVHWYQRILNPFDQYANLFIGLSGLGLMVLSSFFVAKKAREFEGPETLPTLGICFVGVLIGAGLILVWLW